MNIIEQLKAADKAAREARTIAIKNPTPENIAKADAAGNEQDRLWREAAAANNAAIQALAAGTDALRKAGK